MMLRLMASAWWHARTGPALVALALAAAVLPGSPHPLGLVGGPLFARVGGAVEVGPGGWLWMVAMTLFTLSAATIVDTGRHGWVALHYVRGVPPRTWVALQLLLLAWVAAAFAVGLLLVAWLDFGLVGHGPWSLTANLNQVLWLWVALTSIGGILTASRVCGADLVLGTLGVVGLLLLAAFGGPVTPYTPYGQAMASLRALAVLPPLASGAYAVLWMLVFPVAALAAAPGQLSR